MKVRDVMTADPVLVKRRTTLRSAAQLMREFDTGILPVVGDSGVVGTLTDRDVVIRAVADGVSPLTGYVEEVMSPGVVTCEPDDEVDAVAQRMAETRCRRLVVVGDEELPIGIVSIGDLIRHADVAPIALSTLERILSVDADT